MNEQVIYNTGYNTFSIAKVIRDAFADKSRSVYVNGHEVVTADDRAAEYMSNGTLSVRIRGGVMYIGAGADVTIAF